MGDLDSKELDIHPFQWWSADLHRTAIRFDRDVLRCRQVSAYSRCIQYDRSISR